MPFLEAIKLGLAAILSHKLRSFLTLLGVIFGVATVIIVVSLVEGFNHYVDEKIADIGTNAFAVRKFSIDDFSSVAALNAARRRNKDIRLEDAEALRTRGGAIGDVGAKADVVHHVEYHGGETYDKRTQTTNAVTAAAGMGGGAPWVPIPRLEREALAFESIKLAADAGVDLNVANDDGRTALDSARAFKFELVEKFLLERGAKAGAGTRPRPQPADR